MKKIFGFLLFVLSAFYSEGQDKRWFVEGWINPVLYSVPDYGLLESGVGYYDFYIKQPVTQEIGITVGRKYTSNWDWGFGVSYKKIRQNYGVFIQDPRDEFALLEKLERSHQLGFIGTRAFASYSFQKHSIQFILEMNSPYRIRHSFDTPYSNTVRVFLYNGQTARLEIEERLSVGSLSGLDHIVPEFRYGFMAGSNIHLTAGLKWKMYGNMEYYRLSIKGNTFEILDPDTILNDVRILNRYLMLYAGLCYKINWGK